MFIPVALTVGAVLMSPMYDTRYALPMIYTAPVLLCFCAAGVASKAKVGHEGVDDEAVDDSVVSAGVPC